MLDRNGLQKRFSGLRLGFGMLSLCLWLTVPQPAKAEKVLSGAVCQDRVSRLTREIQWQSDFDSACERAREKKKLILWVNMVGKLEGDT
ncbi:MAG TPA: hypothetical protein PKD05_20215 [Candidatus Melainabacteria bacterium]|nr:hypothetical protein [Candidatus Melainabacteria bacterium]